MGFELVIQDGDMVWASGRVFMEPRGMEASFYDTAEGRALADKVCEAMVKEGFTDVKVVRRKETSCRKVEAAKPLPQGVKREVHGTHLDAGDYIRRKRDTTIQYLGYSKNGSKPLKELPANGQRIGSKDSDRGRNNCLVFRDLVTGDEFAWPWWAVFYGMDMNEEVCHWQVLDVPAGAKVTCKPVMAVDSKTKKHVVDYETTVEAVDARG